jgi:hypothetical protein
VAATRSRLWLRRLAGLLGGLLAASGSRGAVLPEDVAEAMGHVYNGGGVTASGPALLVRKSVADTVSLTGTYYVDMVSNASIDVVTTASPYKETRTAFGLGLNYAVRETLITVAGASSREPDYLANAINVDLAQDVFGGMTTVGMGFTKGEDKVGQHGTEGWFDHATHWRYRLGATQILSPSWLAAVNVEAISDEGYLGSPYRVARVFGAAVPERVPRTRSSRALQLRAVGDLGEKNVVIGIYRYFWDTWGLTAHTAELGYGRYFGEAWMANAFVRYHAQQGASFYSDNATVDTAYVTRNRQLSTFNDTGVGALLTYAAVKPGAGYAVNVTGSVEALQFKYSDFTDIRTGNLYAFNALLAQLVVSVTF